MEFQRTVVADYAHIQRLMFQYEDWGDLWFVLLDGGRAFQPRSAVRCTKIMGLLFKQSEGDWDYAHQLIDLALSVGLEERFWNHVTRLPDLIDCDLIPSGITLQMDGSYSVAASCRKETAMCNLPNFLTQHVPQLRLITEYLNQHPNAIKQQDRVASLFANILTDPRAALGQGACWPLGDVLIALQVPTDTAVWTIDADFLPLTQALGLQVYTPSTQPV